MMKSKMKAIAWVTLHVFVLCLLVAQYPAIADSYYYISASQGDFQLDSDSGQGSFDGWTVSSGSSYAITTDNTVAGNAYSAKVNYTSTTAQESSLTKNVVIPIIDATSNPNPVIVYEGKFRATRTTSINGKIFSLKTYSDGLVCARDNYFYTISNVYAHGSPTNLRINKVGTETPLAWNANQWYSIKCIYQHNSDKPTNKMDTIEVFITNLSNNEKGYAKNTFVNYISGNSAGKVNFDDSDITSVELRTKNWATFSAYYDDIKVYKMDPFTITHNISSSEQDGLSFSKQIKLTSNNKIDSNSLTSITLKDSSNTTVSNAIYTPILDSDHTEYTFKLNPAVIDINTQYRLDYSGLMDEFGQSVSGTSNVTFATNSGFGLQGSTIGSEESYLPHTESLGFDSDVDIDTLDNIKLIRDSDQQEVSISANVEASDQSKVNITINETLTIDANYTLDLSGIKSSDGIPCSSKLTFKAIEPTTTMTSIPANNATDVGIRTNIIVNFNDPIDPATFSKNEISVIGGSASIQTAQLSNDRKTAVLTFAQKLSFGTNYTVTLSRNIKTTEGLKLDDSRSFSFTTVAHDLPDVIDELSDTGKMYDYSKINGTRNFDFATDDPTSNGGDLSRIILGKNPAPAYLIYKVNGDIASFKVNKLIGNSQRPTNEAAIKIYVKGSSGDWQDVTPEEKPISVPGLASWMTGYIHEKADIPAGMKYLKVEIHNRAQAADTYSIWSPKITRVEIKQKIPSTPSIVDSSDPINGAQDVTVKNGMKIHFNNPMDTSTLNKENFAIDHGVNITNVTVDSSRQEVTLSFDRTLAYNTPYKVTVSDRVANYYDVSMISSVISFSTESPLVFTANPVVKQGSTVLTELKKGTVNVSVPVTNQDVVPATAAMVVGLYEGDALLDIKYVEKTNILPGNDNLSLNMDIPEPTTDHYLKVFFWNNVTDAKPIKQEWEFPQN